MVRPDGPDWHYQTRVFLYYLIRKEQLLLAMMDAGEDNMDRWFGCTNYSEHFKP